MYYPLNLCPNSYEGVVINNSILQPSTGYMKVYLVIASGRKVPPLDTV